MNAMALSALVAAALAALVSARGARSLRVLLLLREDSRGLELCWPAGGQSAPSTASSPLRPRIITTYALTLAATLVLSRESASVVEPHGEWCLTH